MRRRILNVVIATAFAACGPAASNVVEAAQERPTSTNERARSPRLAATGLTMFRLNAGMNRIPNFMGDGREGVITLAWRDNGNAHGFDVFMVMAPTTVGGTDYNVVTIGGDHDLILTDTPHVEEDFVRSVRFGRGSINGRQETLLFIASRQIETGYYSPARTRIEVMRLRHRGDDPLGPNDFFEPFVNYIAARSYCNSEVALLNEVGVPLRQGFPGFNRVDGCEN